MVWIAVTLTLLLLAAVGLLTVVLIDGRREFGRLPGGFVCRLRLAHGALPGLPRRWKGRSVRAAWAHDVLLVRRGPLRATTRVFHVCSVEGAMREVSPRDVRGLGLEPVLVRLRLDEGDVVEVAAPAPARELLVGPFLAACVNDDDQPRRRPRQSRVDPE